MLNGVTIVVDPNALPGNQVYVLAPAAVNVAEAPEQSVAALVLAVITGNGFTLIVTAALDWQVPLRPSIV